MRSKLPCGAAAKWYAMIHAIATKRRPFLIAQRVKPVDRRHTMDQQLLDLPRSRLHGTHIEFECSLSCRCGAKHGCEILSVSPPTDYTRQ